MRYAPETTRLGSLVVLVAVVSLLAGGAFYIRADSAHAPGSCPLCHTQGIAVPDREQLTKCECEQWWQGQAPARLMFADCSHRQCAESGPQAIVEAQGEESLPLVYLDLQLYRCPKDGLLFTDPE